MTWSLVQDSLTNRAKVYSYVVAGYELLARNNQTIFRYLPRVLDKTKVFDLGTTPETRSDQRDWNFNKLVATSYFRYDRALNGTQNFIFTVYFRNGTVAQFNNANFGPNSFVRYLAPPTSYFSWYTLNEFNDGSKEYVYSDFITITKGPSIPVTPPPNASNDFIYQRNKATALL